MLIYNFWKSKACKFTDLSEITQSMLEKMIDYLDTGSIQIHSKEHKAKRF